MPLAYLQLLRTKAALEEQAGMAESVVGNRVVLDKAEGGMVVVERIGRQERVGTVDETNVQLSIHHKNSISSPFSISYITL